MFERRYAEKPAVYARLVGLHKNFVLAYDVALRVFVVNRAADGLPGLRIISGYGLPRRPGLASCVYPSRFDWSNHAAPCPRWSARDQPHYLAQARSQLRRQYVIENLVGTVHLNPWLHQIAVHVRDCGSKKRHLKRRHLSGVALTVTF